MPRPAKDRSPGGSPSRDLTSDRAGTSTNRTGGCETGESARRYLREPDLPTLPALWQGRDGTASLRPPPDWYTHADVCVAAVQRAGVFLQGLLSNPTPENLVEAERIVSRLSDLAALDGEACQVASLRSWAEDSGEAIEERPFDMSSKMARIAAAFHAWPHHAAVYYGAVYPEPKATEDRLVARSRLGATQRLLYAHPRWTLSFLRECFGLWSFEGLRDYLQGEGRASWRPSALTGNLPDLCAVDFIGVEIANVLAGRPRLRRALRQIQESFLTGRALARPVNDEVKRAFTDLHVAHLLVLFYPDTYRLPDNDYPLHELIHIAGKEREQFEALVPFLMSRREDLTAGRSIRKLTHVILGRISDRKLFQKHREEIREHLVNSPAIIPGGRVTSDLLRNPPPTGEAGWPAWFSEGALEQLDEIPEREIPDWDNHAFWWTRLDGPDALASRLFPGGCGPHIHANHHASAYFDYLAASKRDLLGSWDEIRDRISSEALPGQKSELPHQFSHLIDLLLRGAETEVRTSFLLGVTATDKPGRAARSSAKYTQAVVGTFLGVERPGIPFEPYRFQQIIDHLRPLVLALIQICTTWASRRLWDRIRDQEAEYQSRVESVIDLLAAVKGSGDDPDYSRGPLGPHQEPGRDTLFYVRGAGSRTDHTSRDILTPSRRQIGELFCPTHWNDASKGAPATPRTVRPECDKTWKALLCLGGGGYTLADFTHPNRANASAFELKYPSCSKEQVLCPRCLFDAFRYFLVEFQTREVNEGSSAGRRVSHRYELNSSGGSSISLVIRLLREQQAVYNESTIIQIFRDLTDYCNESDFIQLLRDQQTTWNISDLYLPSRPGIRFVMAVSDFIQEVNSEGEGYARAETVEQEVNSEGEGYARVETVELSPESLKLHFSPYVPNLAYQMREWQHQSLSDHMLTRDNKLHSSFLRLLHVVPNFKSRPAEREEWEQFLRLPGYAVTLTPVIDPDGAWLELRWQNPPPNIRGT